MSLALPITLTFNKRQVADVLEKIMQVDTLRRGVTVKTRSRSQMTVSFPKGRPERARKGLGWGGGAVLVEREGDRDRQRN